MKLTGTKFNDRLIGASKADTIHGLGGNDVVVGNGGNDVLYGDAGNDEIDGGVGSDRLYGGDGNDTMIDFAGNDYMNGGFGRDFLYGRGTLIGGQGDDSVFVLSGVGYGDNPEVATAVGNDEVVVDLRPAPGESRTLVGGRGADRFFVTAEENDGISTRVVICDFNAAEGDHVVLQGRFGSFPERIDTANFDLNHDGQLVAGEGPATRLEAKTGSLVLDLAVDNHFQPDQLVFQGHASVAVADFLV